jgi:hypothetical protein
VSNVSPPGSISNPAVFTITPATTAPAPVLSNISTRVVGQGTRQMQLTLVGANFRPGARVVIGASQSNPGLVSATDIVVENVTRLNDSTIQALVSVAPQASLETRSVDVVNTDRSSTNASTAAFGTSSTTLPLRVQGGNSLGAPLQVTALVVNYPRDNAIVSQGSSVYAEAVLSGSGTGTVIGQWLWDDAVLEQFAVNLAGGTSQTLRTSSSLPTGSLGSHTLVLKITSPNSIQTPARTVVVSPGDMKQERLLSPQAGQGFLPEQPPSLKWTIVPGAAKYQVGFSTEPQLRSITEWHDVSGTEWKVPAEIWGRLPAGGLYWTVRPVELSGVAEQAALMRRIQRVADGALAPMSPSADGASLQWQELKSGSGKSGTLYRVTIFSDTAGSRVVRRVLTISSKIDLRSLADRLTAGQTYYWQVEAFAGEQNGGQLILSGSRQSFVAPAQRRAAAAAPSLAATIRRSNVALRSGSAQTPEDRNAVSRPASGSSVSEDRPLISVELSSGIAGSVSLLVDDTDVSSMIQVSGNRISYMPSLSLANGSHQVAFSVGTNLVNWTFSVAADSPQQGMVAAMPGTDAEALPPAPSAVTPAVMMPNPNFLKGQITSNTQSVSRQDPEKNEISIAAQGLYVDGNWKAELNSTGMIASTFSSDPRHVLGSWKDYVFKLTHGAAQSPWGAEVSFGMLAPRGMLNSEFITTGFAREGVEGAVRTPAGTLSFYRNTDDKGQGEGVGFAFHQQVQSLAYELPALKLFNDAERVKFRMTYMGARDIDGNPNSTDPFARPRVGDTLGGLLTVRLNNNFVWNTEYAVASNNVNRLLAGSTRELGRAFRSGIVGNWHQASITLAVRKVSPSFAIPATANLSQLSQSNRRGMDFTIARQTRIGALSGTYQVLGSDFNYADRAHLILHNVGVNWSKMVGKKTTLGLGATDARTLTTAHAVPSSVLKTDQRRFGVMTSVTEMFNSKKGGSLMLNLIGTRNWLRDNINNNANNIVSTIGITPNWTPKPSVQIQGNYSVNWIVGETTTVGRTRVQTLFLQPTFQLARTGWSVIPLISINEMKAELAGGFQTSDLLNSQAGTRITYQLPGRLRFNSFSFEGTYNRSHNALTNTTVATPRFLVLWTLIGSRSI